MTDFEKRQPDAPPGFFEAEAAGLRWLAVAGGARTARVLDVGPGFIRLEGVRESVPTPEAARAFGAALATTHASGAAAFGAPPHAWDGPIFIGRREMATASESNWGRFYVRDRVLPFLEIAVAVGTVSAASARVIHSACERVAAGEFDDAEPPARIHGDLWAGNVLWSDEGVVLIDPAAHGGHRETGLAMLALFGCPHLDEVLAGYRERMPLLAGFEHRIPLHQLHPLAVHAAGHGPHYGAALHRAALSVLAL
jgi:fructosamine-3-kinase